MNIHKIFTEIILRIQHDYDPTHLLIEGIYFFIKLLIAIITYYLFNNLFKIVIIFQKKIIERKVKDRSLLTFVLSLSKLIFSIISLNISLLIIGFKEHTLLAFFGTIGLGLGLALKDNLSNLSGGILILFFKIYTVGDEVEIDKEKGYIHEIDIFSTTIRSYDNDLIIIPNNLVVSNKVINYTKTPLRRLKFIIGIGYDDNIILAREILENILKNNPLITKEKEISTYIYEYADSSINICLNGWTTNDKYWIIYKETLNRIKEEFDKYGISIPFPQMDIHEIKNK